MPLFTSFRRKRGNEALLARSGSQDEERVKKARRLVLIADLLASHKRNKRIIIAFLTLVLVFLFAVELMYSLGTEHKWQLDLLKVIKGVMAAAYGLIFVAFAPLFILFVRLLKRSFREMY